jgi:hypothetical protein
MSLDRECPECGEEYDTRYGACPVCHPRKLDKDE